MISEDYVSKMSLPTIRSNSHIAGFNSTYATKFNRKVVAWLLSRFSDEPLMPITLTVVPNILLNILLAAPSDLILPASIKDHLADPGLMQPDQVSIVLGAGVWARTAQPESLSQMPMGPQIQRMNFGWIVFGSVLSKSNIKLFTGAVGLTSPALDEESLDDHLQRFWQMEDVLQDKIRTPEQTKCEEHFQQTHRRDNCGRYIVRIPTKHGINTLGTSREIALRRFYQLERRLQRNDALREQYIEVMQNYQSLGHLTVADRAPEAVHFYVPHHCVTKKFRVVFDGSCSTTSGKSFNDMQLVGDRLQEDLIDLIIRFRWHAVAITADIKQMYCQVRVHPDDWDLQRIFWREGPHEPLREYWLTVVTFGMASAPHCAIRAMQQCAIDHRAKWPVGARAVLEDFFVDDGITGAACLTDAQRLRQEMSQVLLAGGFVLDKWRSNRIECTADEDNSDSSCDLMKDTTVLGLKWFPASDELGFKFVPWAADGIVTKRSILSCVAQLYDPIGYLGPSLIIARNILQNLWRRKVGWDKPIPADIFEKWDIFKSQLPAIEQIRIPRWMHTSSREDVQIHGFSDASELAFGAVIYLRHQHGQEIVETQLIASKSRVTPVKSVSIPRLELCAAKLLGQLVRRVKEALRLQMVETILWTDSTIVLHWIKKTSSELKSFVGNRVASIQDTTKDCEWRHVPTSDNPADLLSRGIEPAKLQATEKWWCGPEWLKYPKGNWPNRTFNQDAITEEDKQEERQGQPFMITSFVLKIPDGELFLQKMSSIERLGGTTAYVARAISNFKKKGNQEEMKTGPLSPLERMDAIMHWVKFEQETYFQHELSILRNGELLNKYSSIIKLDPEIDKDGLLRVGGRVKKADIPYAQKHQIVLPEKGRMAQLLIEQAHRVMLHGGVQLMINYIRQKYWIPCIRRKARTVISRCIDCVRQTKESRTQLMGSLPEDRVQPCKAFLHTGVDFAGPYLIRARAGRCKITEKAYVAVFVCMVTKAVHLEVAADLSTAAFIRVFQRFTSTRGRCERLWSDNATNFVGADSELSRQLSTWPLTEMANQLSALGTSWKFITPAAPHQGGLWEAAVKSMKHHLKRVMGSQELTYELLDTLVKQVAGCLNSRPLSALSDDPDDIQALTPGHFLMAEPVVQPPGPYLPVESKDQRTIWLRIQHMVQSFWKQWRADYLNQLQQRTKWSEHQPNIRVGQLVLIKSDDTPPTSWPMGRVTEVHPGADECVRNVTIRTASSKLDRPVQKLIVLPVEGFGAESPRAQSVRDWSEVDVVTMATHTERHIFTGQCTRSRSLMIANQHSKCACVCTASGQTGQKEFRRRRQHK